MLYIIINGKTAIERQRAIDWVSLNVDATKAEVVVPALMIALKDYSPRVRQDSALALALWSPEAATAVPELIDSLNDQDVLVRISAAESIGHIVSRSHRGIDTTVPALMRSLEDPSAAVIVTAAKSLNLLGKGGLATAALIKILKDKQHSSEAMQIMAIKRIVEIDSDEQMAQSALKALLQEGSDHLKVEAARALIFMGSRDEAVLKVIADSMRSKDDVIRSLATEAFNRSKGQ